MILGSKLRDLRLQLNLTQEELADRCELTKGYISQLENDLTSPSIATLVDILAALGSTLREFFSEEEERAIVYTKNDYIIKESEGMNFYWLVPSSQKDRMEPTLVELAPDADTGEHQPHDGEEFGFVLEGEVVVRIGSRSRRCKKGESFYFNCDKAHSVKNVKNTKAKFLWVSAPPNF